MPTRLGRWLVRADGGASAACVGGRGEAGDLIFAMDKPECASATKWVAHIPPPELLAFSAPLEQAAQTGTSKPSCIYTNLPHGTTKSKQRLFVVYPAGSELDLRLCSFYFLANFLKSAQRGSA